MKKILLSLLCLLFIITPVSADMGPKPSIEIDINGLQGKNYFVTLLAKEETTGPRSVVEDLNEIDKNIDNYDIFVKFYNYKDDYHFLGEYTYMDCSDTHRYEWNYYPPQDFKILIYLVDEDRFICSDIYSRYAFTSTYEITVNNDSIDVLKTSDSEDTEDTSIEILPLIMRILVTVIIEVIVLLLFKVKNIKDILYVTGINVGTQILLNVLLQFVFFSYSLYVFELVVLLIEYLAYKLYFKNMSQKNIVSYVIIANVLSFTVGQVLLYLFPTVF